MTCIAWDGKTLAADKLATMGNTKTTTTKIWRVGDLLVGCAGRADQAAEMLNWVIRGRRADDFPESQRNEDRFCSVLVIDGGRPFGYERSPFPIAIEDPVCAIGSGRDFALAAMFCGMTAAEAVKVACHFDSGCGMGIDALDLDQAA